MMNWVKNRPKKGFAALEAQRAEAAAVEKLEEEEAAAAEPCYCHRAVANNLQFHVHNLANHKPPRALNLYVESDAADYNYNYCNYDRYNY